MSKIIGSYLLWSLFIPVVFSQNTTGGNFVKRVEYNLSAAGYNLNSKGDIEKLFSDKVNAPIEFFFEPSSEAARLMGPPSGFRIIKDTSNTFSMLEIKYISNYKEATKEAEATVKEKQKSLMIDVSIEVLNSIPRNLFNLLWTYNSNIYSDSSYLKMYYEELPNHFKIETLSYSISDQFAEKLYEKMVSFIDNFKAKGVPGIMFDGYSVTFRTVVEDEVWSLSIHMPQGDALKMANLCKQIIDDADANKLNESEYNKLLDESF
ncbi:MAG: hypothetical protein FWD60_11870 [Candidatus Azobacteroides sp.]|nr:hypothetical protein [Candidatus Azobacteroides sp.]